MPELKHPRTIAVQGTLIAGESAHIRAENLTTTRGERTLFQDLSLTVSSRTRLAIVGENGRGKTTLLHMLAGTELPDAGSITRHGRIALVEQALEFSPGHTVGALINEAVGEAHAALTDLDEATYALEQGEDGADARYAHALESAVALEAWDADRRIDIALAGLSACTDRARELSTLSVGQRYRVRLAVLLGSSTDILLIDEPTNHLDAASLQFLTDSLKAKDGAVVLVSHDRKLLSDVAQDFMDLDPTSNGKPRTYHGGYGAWLEGKHKEREHWEQEFEKQVEEQHRLENAAQDARDRLSTGWRPPKGTGKHTRATRTAGVVQAFNRRMEELEKFKVTVPEPPGKLQYPFPRVKQGRTVLDAAEVSVEGRILTPVTVKVETGDKFLLVGPNGAGKSTLLSVLGGTLAPTTGYVTPTPGARIATLDQEVPDWEATKTARALYENHIEESGVLARRGSAPTLKSLGLLDRKALHTQVGRLSQGHQRRLQLAMCLAEQPDLLILDEPTNHLSISLVDELTSALRQTASAVIVATHDRRMVKDLKDWKVIELGLYSPPHGV
ncbi:ABC-F family ATP-binding cassette domain-containing protein [Corynebacterium lubricantis]|uniref:ABC-F family ATP-binding cassette domain-containing protein n=1 Tax=Corynebacterium lubricantis TaxID=541095 RepID=UPI00036CE2AA|nr:ABC-F family ATP-binding cassette domain-containing protein [Corynebacterium lubricantis]